MAADNGVTLPLIEEEEPIRQYGDIEASDRRRRKDIDRQSARAVKGGATRGRTLFLLPRTVELPVSNHYRQVSTRQVRHRLLLSLNVQDIQLGLNTKLKQCQMYDPFMLCLDNSSVCGADVLQLVDWSELVFFQRIIIPENVRKLL